MKLISKLVLVMGLTMLMAACLFTHPVTRADTVDQRAYAAYGTYVIFVEKAAHLVERPDIPISMKLQLIEAEERASPVATGLLRTVREYETLRATIVIGVVTEERLVVVSSQLNHWVNRLLPLIDNLIRTVRGASQ